MKISKPKIRGKRYLYVCEKHNYTTKRIGGGLCPICRCELKCLGDRWRIKHAGQFKRKENFTGKKLHAQQVAHDHKILVGPTMRLYKEAHKIWKAGNNKETYQDIVKRLKSQMPC